MADHAYLMAWLLPLFAGAGIVRLLDAAPAYPGRYAYAMGGGWLVGIFLAATGAQWLAYDDTLGAVSRVAPWMLSIGVLAWGLVLLRAWRWRGRGGEAAVAAERRSRVRIAVHAAWWLLLALIVLRMLTLAEEASLRPIFPWDAWSAWAVKPKTWILLGHAEPFVSMTQWLADPAATLRTAVTWNYPELLAWVQVWFASGAGGWNEPLVDLAWSGALAAIALAAYGGFRRFGLPAWAAIGLVYALVSLPLIDAHVALAGYADLWAAVTLGLATLAWARWMLFRERGQWLLAVALALCLPAIKLEGAIWLLLFLSVVVLDLLPPLGRRIVGGIVGAVLVLGLLFGGFVLPMPGLGQVEIAWGHVDIPQVGSYDLAFHPVGGVMLASLFTLPNWHLLWYLLPLLVVLRWRVLRETHAARMLGLFALLQLAFLTVLFFFTDAAAWAQDFTSANRLILQIVPGLFVFAAVLLRNGAAGGGVSRDWRDTLRERRRPISAR